MCYTVQSKTLKAIRYALQRGNVEEAERLKLELQELLQKGAHFHVSGFAHPELLVFTNHQPFKPQAFTWGLVPAWTRSQADAKKIRNSTLNARSESLFEKPAFRDAAKNKRCLVYIDAFYEYHHFGRQTYPYRVALQTGEPMIFAGVWEEWTDRETGEMLKTVSLVTTGANPLMTRIHNNPKAEGTRMPVILPKERQDEWLIDCNTETDKEHLQSLLVPLDEALLDSYTVGRLSGKEAVPNEPQALKEVQYPELGFGF